MVGLVWSFLLGKGEYRVPGHPQGSIAGWAASLVGQMGLACSDTLLGLTAAHALRVDAKSPPSWCHQTLALVNTWTREIYCKSR